MLKLHNSFLEVTLEDVDTGLCTFKNCNSGAHNVCIETEECIVVFNTCEQHYQTLNDRILAEYVFIRLQNLYVTGTLHMDHIHKILHDGMLLCKTPNLYNILLEMYTGQDTLYKTRNHLSMMIL